MQLPKPVKDNLYFLIAEARSQIGNLEAALQTESGAVGQRILDRKGYTYNLKMRIHDGCVDTLRRSRKGGIDIYSLRCAEAIATGLDALAEICHDCVRLVAGLEKPKLQKKRPHGALLKGVCDGLALIEKAIDTNDTRIGVKVGGIESKLAKGYDRAYRDHVKAIKNGTDTEDLVTSLLIAHRIHEMGDLLRNIGQSIVSARLGHPVQLDRVRFLESALTELGSTNAVIEPLAQSNSGSGISGIVARSGTSTGYMAVFKDGTKSKLAEERENVKSWHEIYPGLAPKIFAYKKQGKNASLLIEHLPGSTMQQIVLHEGDKTVRNAVKLLTTTLGTVWSETKQARVSSGTSIRQLRRRLDSVLQIHPEFERVNTTICGVAVKSLEQLLQVADTVEKSLKPPFFVYIHGDFNLDNIIVDDDGDLIRFIDLHRSRYWDYVQDVSVFMVSNYRLQVFDKATRRRIALVVNQFHQFATRFAKRNRDPSFDIRLALGLARSFITSTRFIMDKTLAKNLFLRGIYILESIDQHLAGSSRKFRLPIHELFI